MTEFLSVKPESEYPISGRELHAKFEIETPYNKWFPRMCEYGFEDGKDFNLDKKVRVQTEGSREVSREVTDHMLTLAMAKKLCMLQRSEAGKEVRRYLIAVEAAWNTPDAVMARALNIANARLQALSQDVARLSQKVEQDAPKVLFAEAVSDADGDILVSDLARFLRQNGVNVGQNRLFEMLRRDGFLISRPGSQWDMPTQRSMEMGLFRVKETAFKQSDGKTFLCRTPKVTGKGQVYFINRYTPGCRQISFAESQKQ